MIGILEKVASVVLNIPAYILFAAESLINLVFSAIQGLFSVITSLIPLPVIPVPSYISEINWFFPIGLVVSIMTPLVAGYISFIAIRWIFQKTGNL